MNRRLSEVDKGLEGCQDCRCFIVMLQLISLGLLAALLTVILVKGTENPHSQDYDQEKEHIHQELKQLKDGLDRLCHPCPWDWTLFQGNCYFLSTFQQTWKESLNTCREVGAQLVVVKNDEEQRFLHWISMKKRKTWMGLSDSMKEGQWQWVDGSPLQWRNYWSQGEPNNMDNEDCAEFSYFGWNDISCFLEKFWICKMPAYSCSW